MTNIWIVIIHYKNIAITKACLESIAKLKSVVFNVLVVNNSTDSNESKDLQSAFPSIHILDLAKNLGYSGGANQGIKYCHARKAEYVWLLNNDIIVHNESLKNLCQALHNLPQTAIFGCALVQEFDSSTILGIGKLDFVKAKSYLKESRKTLSTLDCDWLSGSNMLLRLSHFPDQHFFDERYFLYFEDTELCYRKRIEGYNCTLITNAYVIHKDGGSFNKDTASLRSYYHMRNRALFFLSYQKQPWLYFLNFGYIYGHILKQLIVLPLKGQSRKLKAEISGLKDYNLKIFGEKA